MWVWISIIKSSLLNYAREVAPSLPPDLYQVNPASTAGTCHDLEFVCIKFIGYNSSSLHQQTRSNI